MKLFRLILTAAAALCITACADDPKTPQGENQDIAGGSPLSFYVLNQGTMGMNACTLDFYNADTKLYRRNIYPERNPGVALELGDIGNDIAINEGLLYIVVNGSHKVEVCDAQTTIRIGQLDVNSPRYIVFDDKYAYVSSFVSSNDSDKGSVVRFRLSTMTPDGEITVGYCPEQMAIVDGTLYVANSQNYGIGAFDNHLSAIDLASFTARPEADITVGCNLRTLAADRDGNLWVQSQGNYYDIPADLYKIPRQGKSFGTPVSVGVPCSGFAFNLDGSELYYYATVYDAAWNPTNVYGRVDTATATPLPGSFIDGDSDIVSPYCVAVEPATGNIFMTDAKDYKSSGSVLCFDPDGKLLWSAQAGEIPCAIAFTK